MEQQTNWVYKCKIIIIINAVKWKIKIGLLGCDAGAVGLGCETRKSFKNHIKIYHIMSWKTETLFLLWISKNDHGT